MHEGAGMHPSDVVAGAGSLPGVCSGVKILELGVRMGMEVGVDEDVDGVRIIPPSS
jgi:hypothetical protein